MPQISPPYDALQISRPKPKRWLRGLNPNPLVCLSLGLSLFCFNPALADQASAQLALNRADAKIEMAQRQAGLAGQSGDQSFQMARSKREAAMTALQAGQEDTAEMRADEAALLAELTSERAKLAALETSRTAVSQATNTPVIQP